MSQSVVNTPAEVGDLADGSVSESEFLYLDGLSGNIQVQLDDKLDQDNTTAQQAVSFRLENRTSDPSSPTVGQIWLRTDL
jgi:hypothetical protein